MDLFLSREGGKSLVAQLYEQLRLSITSGRLRPGDQLPPSMELADELGISRHTVTTAYERLVAEGYMEGRAGGGSFVTDAMRTPQRSRRRATSLRPARRFEGWEPYFPPPPNKNRFDLRPGVTDTSLFPVAAWRRRLAEGTVAPTWGTGTPQAIPGCGGRSPPGWPDPGQWWQARRRSSSPPAASRPSTW